MKTYIIQSRIFYRSGTTNSTYLWLRTRSGINAMHKASCSRILLRFSSALLLFLAFSGCDNTFEPVKERETHPYSIFGYLESPADTNWIRISEIRNLLYTEKDAEMNAVVTLKHLESGLSETMQDTLVRYQENFYAYNFRSNITVEPEQTYLLTASRSDGQTSSAKVTLPPVFPDPIIDFLNLDNQIKVHLREIDFLADINVSYNVQDLRNNTIRKWKFHHAQDTLQYSTNSRPLPRGEHIVDIRYASHWLTICRHYHSQNIPFSILRSELYVASGSPEWQYFAMRDSLTSQLPDIGNIENGTGYLIGIVSKTIEMDCQICNNITCPDEF